jgi:prolyl-tRNA synthetase
LEIGPQDLAKNQTLAVRRDTGKKEPVSLNDISSIVSELLKTIQSEMFTRARDVYHSRLKEVTKWDDFVPALDNKCVVVIPWCEIEKCEDDIKERSARA